MYHGVVAETDPRHALPSHNNTHELPRPMLCNRRNVGSLDYIDSRVVLESRRGCDSPRK